MGSLPAEEWKIEKRGRSCSGCGRAFGSEEEHYSGIAEVDHGFQRRDVCMGCWDRRPDLFSFWRTRMPQLQDRKLENTAAMVDFFKKLVERPSDDPGRQKITYLTALLLMRKRRLKLLRSAQGQLEVEKAWDGELVRIPDPPIGEGELEDLRRQMEELFQIEIGAGDLGPA